MAKGVVILLGHYRGDLRTKSHYPKLHRLLWQGDFFGQV